jgi:octaprenyl-diphosphate synthase
VSLGSLADLNQGQIRPELLAQVSEEVTHVEAELDRQMHSQVEMVKNVSHHTLDAGGKRLRPAFVALSAKATGLPYDEARSRKIGACMEMIHMATLIHDDVIDNSATRRGKDTASAVYGNTGSILAGDVLLAKAMRILAEDGDLAIIRTTSHSVVEMAEGEVRELETRLQFDLDETAHLEILRLKTASFIQCCCEVGALLTGASEEVQQALHAYGRHVGMAFQIVDDLLDYRGDKAKTGKPLATDFREGQATLPLIFLREKLSEQEALVARQKFGSGVTDDEIRMISGWMASRGSFDRAEALAREHIAKALMELTKLPETPAKALLETVAHYVIKREL